MKPGIKTSIYCKASVAILIGIFVLHSGEATWAQTDGNTSSAASLSAYEPFSEPEINAVLQNPLTLDECIRIALGKNISLRVAKGDLERAEATYSGNYSEYYPVFSLEGTRESTTEKRPVDALDPTTPTSLDFSNRALVAGIQQTLPTGAVINFAGDITRDLYTPDRFGATPVSVDNRAYSVQIRQPILRNAWPTTVGGAIGTARYDREIQTKQFLSAKLQTIFVVKSAFYEVLFQRELIRVNMAAIRRDSTLLAASESKVAAKLATRRDVLSAEIQLASDKASLIKSQSDFEIALDVLKEVMGLEFEKPIQIAELELSDRPMVFREEQLLQLAFENNPSLQSAKVGVDRSRLQLKIAKNQRLPQLDLIAGYNGSFEKNADENIDLRVTGLLGMVSLSYPFMNRAAAASAENAQIALSQQEDNVANLKRQLTLSVRSIIRNARSNIESINNLKRSIEAAEQKVEFASVMFNLGRASNLDITDAQEALLKAQTQFVRELVDYHIQLALLESLTGQPVAQ